MGLKVKRGLFANVICKNVLLLLKVYYSIIQSQYNFRIIIFNAQNNIWRQNSMQNEFDDKIINMIDKKLLEVQQDDTNGVKWLTREEADELMSVNKEVYV